MICPRCGVINPDDTERCKRCRGSLARPPAPVEEIEVRPSPAAEPVAAGPPVPAGPRADAPPITTPPVPAAPRPSGEPPADQMPSYPPPTYPPPTYPPPTGSPLPNYPPPSYAPPGPWSPDPAQGSVPPAPPRNRAVPSYLPWAVLCTLLFWPAGLVAVFFSVQSSRRLHRGQWEGAWQATRAARIWCFVAVAGAIAAWTFLAATGSLGHLPNR